MGNVKVGFSENLVVNISVRKIMLEEKYWKSMIFYSLRKHPFLLALRRWGRFARNVPSGEERGETDVFAG